MGNNASSRAPAAPPAPAVGEAAPPTGASACPVMRKKGNEAVTTAVPPPTTSAPTTSTCPVSKKTVSSSSSWGCPMGYGKKKEETKATEPTPAATTTPKEEGGGYKNPSIFNVYSQKIDPTNNMPSTANQQAAPGQRGKLETQRVVSTIPKGGTADTWVYPSPQMFWNALVRKNKADGADETDMATVVAVHNNMNENTWAQVVLWEDLHPAPSEDRAPKLLRFIGRPDELSPKARLKVWFGHTPPFDRHDWVVDRGGEEVRYIIDYYHDESGVTHDNLPAHLKDFEAMKSIKVDVRPALDSVGSIYDRIFQMPLKQYMDQTPYRDLPFFAPPPMSYAQKQKMEFLNKSWAEIQTKCDSHRLRLENCKDEDECGAAAIALRRCSAGVVCADIALAFDACAKAKPQKEQETLAALGAMDKCLDDFRLDSANLLSSESYRNK